MADSIEQYEERGRRLRPGASKESTREAAVLAHFVELAAEATIFAAAKSKKRRKRKKGETNIMDNKETRYSWEIEPTKCSRCNKLKKRGRLVGHDWVCEECLSPPPRRIHVKRIITAEAWKPRRRGKAIESIYQRHRRERKSEETLRKSNISKKGRKYDNLCGYD